MPDWSRRQTLSALAGVAAAAIAGCQGDASSEPVRSRERRIENYDVEEVRNADGAVLFHRGEEPAGERPGGRHHLTDESELAELTFTDVPEAESLRSFAADTDFESESVALYSRRVPECYDHRLQFVEVDANGPSAHFCRSLRPVDAACRTDAHDTVGFAIRLPFPGDRYSGMGGGMSSTCSRPRRPEAFEVNVTLSDGGDDR